MKHKLVVYHLFWSAVILTTIKFYQAEEIENVEALWEEFKLVNAKTYGNLEEEFNRYKIWVSNYYYVQVHNKNVQSIGNGFTLGLNSFCDMSQEEVAKFKHGLKMNKPSVKKLLKSSSTSNFRGYLGFKLDSSSENKSIPDSMNWVTSGVVSSIKDQGLCGACWSFVSTGALESHLKIRQLSSKLSTLSEQQLIDCSVSYGNEGCDGGLMSQAFEYVKDNKGIYSDSVYAYVGSLNSCKKLKSDMFGPVNGYVSLPIDENVIKEAVARIGPIAIGIDADHKSFTLYKGGIYFEPLCSSENLNHAVLIVGYGQEKGQDYWLIKNSWGTSWGENGFGRIARNKNNHCGIATLAGYPILE